MTRYVLPLFLVVGLLERAGAHVTYTRIADTSTAIPGGIGAFSDLGLPAIDGNIVAFRGDGPSQQQGIYASIDGSLVRIVDVSTEVPEHSLTRPPPVRFRGYGDPSLEGQTVAFAAGEHYAPGGVAPGIGIFTANILGGGGVLDVVADTNTNMMGCFGFPSISDGQVAYFGCKKRDNAEGVAIGVFVGATEIINLDNNSVGFGPISYHRGVLSFARGAWPREAIYFYDGRLSTIAETLTTSVPSGNGVLTGMGPPSVFNGVVTFDGRTSNGASEIYRYEGGVLSTLLDNTTRIPGTTNRFRCYAGTVVGGPHIVFIGSSSPSCDGDRGIYTDVRGGLQRMVQRTDVLDGRVVLDFAVKSEGVSGDRIAFLTTFYDGTKAVYVADINDDVPSIPPERRAGLGESTYRVGYDNGTIRIRLAIRLTGANVSGELMQQWEDGIERAWSGQYEIVNAQERYPIAVDAEFVQSNWDAVVRVIEGDGRPSIDTWYTGNPAGWGPEFQDEMAAHEAGHMFGLYDEYPSGYLDPDTMFTDGNYDTQGRFVSDSIMASLNGQPKDRHYERILLWLEGKTGRRMDLGESPTFHSGTVGLSILDASPVLSGDLSEDGIVNRIDVAIVTANYGAFEEADFDDGDLTGDGRIGLIDLAVLQASLYRPLSTSNIVPEPSTKELLVLAFVIAFIRTRTPQEDRSTSIGRTHRRFRYSTSAIWTTCGRPRCRFVPNPR